MIYAGFANPNAKMLAAYHTMNVPIGINKIIVLRYAIT
jgi:proline dehydrogenase